MGGVGERAWVGKKGMVSQRRGRGTWRVGDGMDRGVKKGSGRKDGRGRVGVEVAVGQVVEEGVGQVVGQELGRVGEEWSRKGKGKGMRRKQGEGREGWIRAVDGVREKVGKKLGVGVKGRRER